MLKPILLTLALFGADAAVAQSRPIRSAAAAICPSGTQYAAIRHSKVKPGQWRAFEAAVAAHNAWYAERRNEAKTALARVLARAPAGLGLSTQEAVTITRYGNAPQPPRDAAWEAFTAQYKVSSDLIDEARVCLPAL